MAKREKNIYPFAGGYYLNFQISGHVYRRFFKTLSDAVKEREWLKAHTAEIAALLPSIEEECGARNTAKP